MMNWVVSKVGEDLISRLEKDLDVSSLIALLLARRNIKNVSDARMFLDAKFSQLSNPNDLAGVKEAVERIKKAKEKKEKVFIFGDYDVDGICACALLKSTLNKIGLETVHHLPHRVDEGYGINMEAVKRAKSIGAKLFISVDCGVTALEEIKELRKLNIDSIIVDHHEPKAGKIPAANVIIDPKVDNQSPKLYDLTAVGLVFKLSQALLERSLEEESDLVALGTICDVAPLLGENRILVKEGLKRISDSSRMGINALKEVGGVSDREITAGLVGFVLGPRINAMGRIESAESSLKLITCVNEEEASLLAKELDQTNKRRQKIEEKILQEAIARIEREINFKEHSIIVLGGADWHPGVVGVIAAKLSQMYFRPTLILSKEDQIYRGSGRSINNFHLFDALCECDSLLQNYGGHKRAAGLSVHENDLEEFKRSINKIAREKLKPEDLIPVLDIDADVPLDLWQDLELVERIGEFSPFGVGNPRPVFSSRGLFIRSQPACVGRKTLRLWVSDGKLTAKAVGFGMADFAALFKDGTRIDLAYSVSIDKWQEPSIQLEIKDIKISA